MEIIENYMQCKVKLPWFIDFLNINLNNKDLEVAKRRIKIYMDAFLTNGRRNT